jgi:hypothetical protein
MEARSPQNPDTVALLPQGPRPPSNRLGAVLGPLQVILVKQNNMPIPRQPIERAMLSEVQARVVFKLVELMWRREPWRLSPHPPTHVLELGMILRDEGFPYLFGAFLSLSKAMQEGLTMREWRDRYPSLRGPRALHKQRLLRGPR